MATLDVGGVELYYTDVGHGPPVVLVHGIPTDYRAWNSTVSALAGDFRVVAYSRRYAYPNLRSGDVTDSTIENNATDLERLIARLDLGRVHLVGHSYGGFVAAYLASQQPTLLRSLTLVEPAIASLLLRDPKSGGEKLELLFRHPRIALSAQRYLKRSNEPALAALAQNDVDTAVRLNLDGIEDRPGVLNGLPAEVRAMMLDNARTVKETVLPYPPLTRHELGGIRRPTLVVRGSTSALWLRGIAEITGASIPLARAVAIPSSGHFPHLANPAAFNGELRQFLLAARA